MKKRKEYTDLVVDEYKKKSNIEKNNANMKRVFTKYKVITYLSIVIFPPYALYRLFSSKTHFLLEERLAYGFVCVSIIGVYLYSFL